MNAPRAARGVVTDFFKSVLERRFSDAERAINDVREKRFDEDEFKAGYINALEGILLSVRSGDERDFVNRAPLEAESREGYGRRFGEFSREGVHAPFDVGFFSAWSDFMRYKLGTEDDG
ncbi:hypothetical protein AC482_03055 [miscellaneous Crenarchaeota group-15 archaeon DG-45]|uniref:Uncharacterized protein n=1 Tax=miscellaneous Crenarchaeota group-15 archaeon DG-45 TaxID=1685127 RepID=A0A0M0BQ95_9ARCH|nr:MAG: hypothetical protein AC482_03055 [miscellaneous Crenarchaeota group-15 archaeon DG-45]